MYFRLKVMHAQPVHWFPELHNLLFSFCLFLVSTDGHLGRIAICLSFATPFALSLLFFYRIYFDTQFGAGRVPTVDKAEGAYP